MNHSVFFQQIQHNQLPCPTMIGINVFNAPILMFQRYADRRKCFIDHLVRKNRGWNHFYLADVKLNHRFFIPNFKCLLLKQPLYEFFGDYLRYLEVIEMHMVDLLPDVDPKSLIYRSYS